MKTIFKLFMLTFLALGSMPVDAMQMNKEEFNWKLIHASREGNLEAAQDAIRAGADVNAKDKKGWTPLVWAALRGHKENIQCLNEAGADLNALDSYGWSIVMFAVSRRHREVVEYLIEEGVDLNVRNDDGNSTLIIAARGGNRSVCDLLVETMLKCPEDACAAHFCMKNIDDNGNIFIDIIEPVCQRLRATRYLGYEKTLEEVKKIQNDEIKRALLAKYFPDEVKNGSVVALESFAGQGIKYGGS